MIWVGEGWSGKFFLGRSLIEEDGEKIRGFFKENREKELNRFVLRDFRWGEGVDEVERIIRVIREEGVWKI